jgi:hypothetical protein
MSLKARLRIAILALVTFVVVAMSILYLYDFTNGAFSDASSRAAFIADQVKGSLVDRLDGKIATPGQRPSSLNDWKQAWTEIIRNDPSVTEMLKRTLANAGLVLAIVVTNEQGKVLAASNPALVDEPVPPAGREILERRFVLLLGLSSGSYLLQELHRCLAPSAARAMPLHLDLLSLAKQIPYKVHPFTHEIVVHSTSSNVYLSQAVIR